MKFSRVYSLVSMAVLVAAAGLSHGAPTDGQLADTPVVRATPLDGVPYRIVSYSDLDLARDGDRLILKHRIRRAVELVCDTHDSRNIKLARLCRDEAYADAVSQVSEKSAVLLVSAR